MYTAAAAAVFAVFVGVKQCAAADSDPGADTGTDGDAEFVHVPVDVKGDREDECWSCFAQQ